MTVLASSPASNASSSRPAEKQRASALPGRWRLPPVAAFSVFALVLFGFFFAASAPSPIFLVLQKLWHFSPMMLTVAYAIYVVALLSALLVAGSLSDHVGRRPVLIGALILQSIGMAMFLIAEGIGGLLAARLVQGLATGIATGAMSAAIVETAPVSHKKLGMIISNVSPLAGLAVGAFLTGIAISYSADPTHIVFTVLTVLFALAAVAVWFSPESVTPRPGVLSSLVPRISIPVAARSYFMRASLAFVTTWAVAGLFLALAPSIVLHVFHVDSGFVNGLAIAVLCAFGAIAPFLLKPLPSARAAVIGMVAVAVGMLLAIVAVQLHSIATFFVAAAMTGVGFGGGFSAIMQTLAQSVGAHERAELFAGVFTICYLAFSVPALLAGALVKPLGLQTTVEGYAALVVIGASLGAWMLSRPQARAPATA